MLENKKSPVYFNTNCVKPCSDFQDENSMPQQEYYMEQPPEQQQTDSMLYRLNNPSYNQNYSDQVYCHDMKRQIDINTNKIMLEQKYDYQTKVFALKAKANADKQFTYPEIFKSKDGELSCFIATPDGIKLSNKKLLNARGYRTYLYFSTYPSIQTVLAIAWNYDYYDDYDYDTVYFSYDRNGIKPNDFIKKLNSHGLQLLVSQRMQKELAPVLIEYSVEIAIEKEIPFDFGWWKDLDEKWHFAHKDSKIITMREVRSKIEL